MFANAIKEVGNYTRPILTITREYGSSVVRRGSATLFFVNDEGDAVTCRHVAKMIMDADKINRRYEDFKKERENGTPVSVLEEKYGYKPGVIAEMRHNFVDSVDKITSIQCLFHPTQDLAVIRLNGYGKIIYRGHAVFSKNDAEIQPGDFLCRLGFPFPEFTGYFYDSVKDNIGFDPNGKLVTPRFPIEGMMTRHLAGEKGEMIGFELSTPGLRGQSGGPLFDKNGIVYGMQYRTGHLPLGFDLPDKNASAFLNVGHCVSAGIIKKFLEEHHIKFYTEDDLTQSGNGRIYRIC